MGLSGGVSRVAKGADGKSAALFHHRAICKTPMALSDNGFLGAIAGKKSLPTIEVAPARHSEGSPLALPSRARFRCACPRRYRREHSSRPQQGNGTSRNRSNQGCRTEGCRSPADKTLVTWILHRPSGSGAWRTAHGGRIGGRRSRRDAWHPPTIGEGQRERGEA